MTMQAWSPDPGGTNYGSRSRNADYFRKLGARAGETGQKLRKQEQECGLLP